MFLKILHTCQVQQVTVKSRMKEEMLWFAFDDLNFLPLMLLLGHTILPHGKTSLAGAQDVGLSFSRNNQVRGEPPQWLDTCGSPAELTPLN